MEEIDNILAGFVAESFKKLDRLQLDLRELEGRSGESERVERMIRTLDSLRWPCGFFGLERLESAAREGEQLLARVRDARQQLNAPMIASLLAMVDGIREMLGTIDSELREKTIGTGPATKGRAGS